MKEKIEQDLKAAQKARDDLGISVRRMLLADIHNQEIANRQALSREQVVKILQQAAKKHQDSIAQFESGARMDLADKERAELKLIQSYLPEALSEGQLRELVQAAIAKLGAAGPKEFGKVMQAVMQEAQGRAGGSEAAQMVKAELGKTS